jgi:RNA polymerase sigma-70 factor (ECF subfamily)
LRESSSKNQHGPAGQTEPSAPAPREHSARIAELFAAHNRALLRFLTCRLQSSQEAKEIAQEAYVRLLRLDSSDGIGYLRAFLFKTAANLAADRLKSAARRERIDRLDFGDETLFAPSSEQELAAEQELMAVVHVVEELPPKCRYAFVMHSFYGCSFQEVAASMGLSERMVRLYVERALVFCRERLDRP